MFDLDTLNVPNDILEPGIKNIKIVRFKRINIKVYEAFSWWQCFKYPSQGSVEQSLYAIGHKNPGYLQGDLVSFCWLEYKSDLL